MSPPLATSRTRFRAVASLLVAGAWLVGADAAADAPLAGDPFFLRWDTIGTTEGLPAQKILAVAVEGSTVWVGTEEGLASLDENGVHLLTFADGLPSRVVTALAVGRTTGDLWIGTVGGLARLSAGRLDAFTQLDSGLANDVVYGVAVDGGDVWVATAAGLSRYDTRTRSWEIFDTSNTLMHEPWCYAVTAAEGIVYAAVWGGGVIVRDRGSGRFREHRDPDGEMEIDLFRNDGLVHDVTSAVAVSQDVLWVGSYFGLSRYDGRRWRSYNQEDSGLAGDFINALRTEADAVWIATDQGVSRFDSRTWHTWRAGGSNSGPQLRVRGPGGHTRTLHLRTGPSSNTILGVAFGKDVWLATANGLNRAIRRARPHPSRSASGPR